MSNAFSRRDFGKLVAGGAAGAALLQVGRSAALAAPVAGYKAMVGIFLFGGNDGWNMVVPTDSRYTTYTSMRGPLALAQSNLTPLTGSAYSLNSAMAPLQSVWDQGALNVVLNTGSLFAPLTKATYTSRKDLVPASLMSHSQEQAHWQGMRVQGANPDGFMGRMYDRTADSAIPSLMSFADSNLILFGAKGKNLILPSSGIVTQNGDSANAADPAIFARKAAITALASGDGFGAVTATTAGQISDGYTQSATANSVLGANTSTVDKFFVDAKGVALTSDIAKQLNRTARMIEARSTLGHARQTFFVSQGGYDTHANQAGQQTKLLGDLANAMTAFHNAMKSLGLAENVTSFTMSDFGRVYKGNGSGSDHAWGNIHLVMGGALKSKQVLGTYPTLTFGGESDAFDDGRWIPTTSQEEYVGAIAKWHGVADADMPYVFPNWSTWSSNGRGPIGLFQS